MAALQDIKRRIRSVKNTRQITKAMQLVAASKLRRYAEEADKPRRYLEVADSIVGHLTQGEASDHPLLNQTEKVNPLIIVVAGDRTLAGPSNAQVMRCYGQLAAGYKSAPEVIAIGRQAELQLARRDDAHELAAYELEVGGGDDELARPITAQVRDYYLSGRIDHVQIIYTEFESTVIQSIKTVQLLPAALPDVSVSQHLTPTLEPDAATVLDAAITAKIEAQIQCAILSARASEQAARMIAMMSASDNASDLIDDYTLEYNTARQAAITQELAEISGGAEAIAQ